MIGASCETQICYFACQMHCVFHPTQVLLVAVFYSYFHTNGIPLQSAFYARTNLNLPAEAPSEIFEGGRKTLPKIYRAYIMYTLVMLWLKLYISVQAYDI